MSKGKEENGNKVGYWIYYYENGSVKEAREYKFIKDMLYRNCMNQEESVKIGKWQSYHINGVLKSVGFYQPNLWCKYDTVLFYIKELDSFEQIINLETNMLNTGNGNIGVRKEY